MTPSRSPSRILLRSLLAGTCLLVALAAGGCVNGTSSANAGALRADVLVYARTLGFRHDSIPAATAAVTEIAAVEGLER